VSVKIETITGEQVIERAEGVIELYLKSGFKLIHFSYDGDWVHGSKAVMVFYSELTSSSKSQAKSESQTLA
jgi:hypothetical protein